MLMVCADLTVRRPTQHPSHAARRAAMQWLCTSWQSRDLEQTKCFRTGLVHCLSRHLRGEVPEEHETSSCTHRLLSSTIVVCAELQRSSVGLGDGNGLFIVALLSGYAVAASAYIQHEMPGSYSDHRCISSSQLSRRGYWSPMNRLPLTKPKPLKVKNVHLQAGDSRVTSHWFGGFFRVHIAVKKKVLGRCAFVRLRRRTIATSLPSFRVIAGGGQSLQT